MKQEIAGQKFGMLTAVREQKQEGNGKRYWLCKCECGKETVVEEWHLKSGHTKSCGCYRGRRQREKGLDLTGERYGRLVVLGPVKGEDDLICGWKCRCDCGNVCVRKKVNLRSGVTRSCGCLRDEQRKKNMEKAIHFVDGTCVERIAVRKNSANNTTGHRGVYHRKNGKWCASIDFQGKRYHLGSFETYEAAVEARLEAEERFYDTFLARYEKKRADGTSEKTASKEENVREKRTEKI